MNQPGTIVQTTTKCATAGPDTLGIALAFSLIQIISRKVNLVSMKRYTMFTDVNLLPGTQ
jgi:hypothetical protein